MKQTDPSHWELADGLSSPSPHVIEMPSVLDMFFLTGYSSQRNLPIFAEDQNLEAESLSRNHVSLVGNVSDVT